MTVGDEADVGGSQQETSRGHGGRSVVATVRPGAGGLPGALATPPEGSRRSPRRSSAVRAVDLLPAAIILGFQAWAAVAFSRIDEGSNPRLLWDATAYLRIAEGGYPTGGSPGAPPEGYTLYAWHPLYPMVNRVLGEVTGFGPGAVAPWVNLAAAAVGLVILSAWLRPLIGLSAVIGATVVLAAAPASPVLQMGYTEGLAFLLIVTTCLLLERGRYTGAAVLLVLLALTRPIGPPLLAVVVWVAWLAWRRSGSLRAAIAPLGVLAVGAAGLLLWPVLAGLMSGDPGVYWTAHTEFAPVDAPLSPVAAGLTYPWFGGLVLAVLLINALIAWRLLPGRTPSTLRAWAFVYLPYMSVAALVSSSLLRYPLLAFPLGLALAPLLRHRFAGPVVLAAIVGLGMVTQWWWVHEFVPLGGDGTFP